MKIFIACKWIWEKPVSMHNHKYLEILILINQIIFLRGGKQMLACNSPQSTTNLWLLIVYLRPSISSSLSHQGPARKPKLIEQGVTIFTIFSLLNDLNVEKNLSPVVTWTPSNVQSRHTPWEPHTNQDGIFLCILPYLNISDFSWLKITGFLVHYPTRDLQGSQSL